MERPRRTSCCSVEESFVLASELQSDAAIEAIAASRRDDCEGPETVGYHLIARDVSATAATFSATAVDVDESQPAFLRIAQRDLPIGWQSTRGVRHHELRVGGLTSSASYAANLIVGGGAVATCSVTTLPERLPRPDARPFIIFLGSCFCRLQDEQGEFETTYASLPTSAKPDVHVWSGDQVYLDAPWYRFARPHSGADLESMFRDNYALTWDPRSSGGSLGRVLTSAANYFTSDDHEFWNNAPNRGAYVLNSWTASGRAEWKGIAGDLYETFQTPSRLSPPLEIGNLSLITADVRIDRDSDERRFMTDSDLARIRQWVEGLRGPGFLALGQPLFSMPEGFSGHFFDWGLADYAQYVDLVNALCATSHTIVILTGDVHFGRVSHCTLGSGAELIEIISSPLALVDPTARGKWRRAPEKFPGKPIKGGPAGVPVETNDFEAVDPHFLTLELHGHGDAVDLSVRHWPVGRTSFPAGRVVFQRRLR